MRAESRLCGQRVAASRLIAAVAGDRRFNGWTTPSTTEETPWDRMPTKQRVASRRPPAHFRATRIWTAREARPRRRRREGQGRGGQGPGQRRGGRRQGQDRPLTDVIVVQGPPARPGWTAPGPPRTVGAGSWVWRARVCTDKDVLAAVRRTPRPGQVVGGRLRFDGAPDHEAAPVDPYEHGERALAGWSHRHCRHAPDGALVDRGDGSTLAAERRQGPERAPAPPPA